MFVRNALAGAPELSGLGGCHQLPDQPGLYATNVYPSKSLYFDRDEVALKNFAKYFLHQFHGKREHAEKLMKMQNQGGGLVFLQDIKKPNHDDWERQLSMHYLHEQVKSFKELEHVTNLRKMGALESGMTEWPFDKDTPWETVIRKAKPDAYIPRAVG
ncbi:Ferritin heavy chain [Tupaia chinensis]|uniref:Ferritin heavy chain n=1 Tax=Tupaia chinensis TaxID=246437 RepID=L9JCZ5_TUPCH|nr:Ferritin heavy chain [Tupaia chinensis]